MCTVTGGINFDAKLRRESTALVDLFYGHISGMDALARALRNAAQMLEVRLHLLLPFTIPDLDVKESSFHGNHDNGQTERGTQLCVRCKCADSPCLLRNFFCGAETTWTDAAVPGVLININCMQDGVLPGMVKDRYSSYSESVGKRIRDGKVRDVLILCPSTDLILHILRSL